MRYTKKILHWPLIFWTCISCPTNSPLFGGRCLLLWAAIAQIYLLYSQTIQHTQTSFLNLRISISINPAEADICNGIVNMWAQSGFAEGKNQESVRNGGNRIIWSPTTRINSSHIKEIFSDKCVINLNLKYNNETDFNW